MTEPVMGSKRPCKTIEDVWGAFEKDNSNNYYNSYIFKLNLNTFIYEFLWAVELLFMYSKV